MPPEDEFRLFVCQSDQYSWCTCDSLSDLTVAMSTCIWWQNDSRKIVRSSRPPGSRNADQPCKQWTDHCRRQYAQPIGSSNPGQLAIKNNAQHMWTKLNRSSNVRGSVNGIGVGVGSKFCQAFGSPIEEDDPGETVSSVGQLRNGSTLTITQRKCQPVDGLRPQVPTAAPTYFDIRAARIAGSLILGPTPDSLQDWKRNC